MATASLQTRGERRSGGFAGSWKNWAVRRAHGTRTVRLGALILAATVMLFRPLVAQAVPSFALQTGQPCTSCHIGAFGPQLTAFGRAFKIGGYTQTGGDGWQSALPASVMLLGS